MGYWVGGRQRGGRGNRFDLSYTSDVSYILEISKDGKQFYIFCQNIFSGTLLWSLSSRRPAWGPPRGVWRSPPVPSPPVGTNESDQRLRTVCQSSRNRYNL